MQLPAPATAATAATAVEAACPTVESSTAEPHRVTAVHPRTVAVVYPPSGEVSCRNRVAVCVRIVGAVIRVRISGIVRKLQWARHTAQRGDNTSDSTRVTIRRCHGAMNVSVNTGSGGVATGVCKFYGKQRPL